MHNFRKIFIILFCSIFIKGNAQNPLIHNQFTADPTARVFNGKVFLFPSHDIKTPEGVNLRKDWFCMADYHVFSSENLTDWTDHGVIVSQNKVKWVDSISYSMWAPDCVERNGKYYFYFPAITSQADENGRKSFGIGVAVADNPEVPYNPLDKPVKNIKGIDPNVFIDKNGQAYIFWSQGNIYGAKLKENMTELDSEPVILTELPQKGLKEGPFMFERSGIFYLTYPHVENKIERLEYAIGDNPLGPYKFAGVIMDEAPNGCWTNHHSVINYKDQWYLFYHQNDFSPKFDKNRSVRIDSLFFNTDGSIRKVKPTLRGVGITRAEDKIQLDRYSNISEKGAQITFNDTLNYFRGWKTILNTKNAWIQYNSVDFEDGKQKQVEIKYLSPEGTVLTLSLNDKAAGTIKIPASKKWKTTRINISGITSGVKNLTIKNSGNNVVELDWIRFE